MDSDPRVIQRNFQIVGAIAVAVITLGVIFYHFVEDLTWIDSLYFCVITLTTVGYGDITPQTDVGKLFTVFYVLIGIGIIATFANLMLKRTVARRQIRKEEHLYRHDAQQ